MPAVVLLYIPGVTYMAESETGTVARGSVLDGFLGWTGRPLRAAYVDPAPATVGLAVGACVLRLIILDAAFAATVGPTWALVALAFLVHGEGDLDFESVFAALEDIGYTGFATLELYTYPDRPDWAAGQAYEALERYVD